MVIGIYSGSFDPLHIGHTMVASYVAQYGGVDRVWLLVSRINPLKEGVRQPASDADRLAMARLAVSGVTDIEVSDIEMHLPSPSYTYETLCELRRQHPGHQFRLIIGSDNLLVFDKWRNADRILREFGVIVFPRPGYEVEPSQVPEGARLLTGVPVADISSTFIRRAAAEGKDVRFFLPAGIADYIATRRLYHR